MRRLDYAPAAFCSWQGALDLELVRRSRTAGLGWMQSGSSCGSLKGAEVNARGGACDNCVWGGLDRGTCAILADVGICNWTVELPNVIQFGSFWPPLPCALCKINVVMGAWKE